jgi:hypothetical protein
MNPIRIIASTVAVLASGSAFALPINTTTIVAIAVLEDGTKILTRFESDTAARYGLAVATGHGKTETFVSAGRDILKDVAGSLTQACAREIFEDDIKDTVVIDTDISMSFLDMVQPAELKTLIDVRSIKDRLYVAGIGPDAEKVVSRFGMLDHSTVLETFYGITAVSVERHYGGATVAATEPAPAAPAE